jgi:NADH-quinone oxidoreductase subunit J
MYSDYLLPFELAAVVLLVAIVAAISLTLREKRESKSINPSEQVVVRKEDRLRMVDMKSEAEPKSNKSNTEGEAS